MERSRKRKILLMLILSVTIAGLSIGFAAFSATLNISSSANVSVNSDTFIVKFSTSKDSLIMNEVEPSYMSPGISASAGVIDNSTNPTISNLSATFTEPGQYVEYTFYARNEGEYTAYLNSINYFREKFCESSEDISANVQSACDSIDLKVYVNDSEYLDTTEISGHSLEKKTGEEIRLIIDYPSTGGWADAPFSVTFPSIMMIYSTIDDSTFIPSDSFLNYKFLLDIVKDGASLDDRIDFSSSDGLDSINNVAYIRTGTENDENPVYYYRGNVTKNNVKFANFCWKIVRTTNTGGVKLIYNGIPSEDGSCNVLNDANKFIATSFFNGGYHSPAIVGYMYGKVYPYSSMKMSDQDETFVYANDIIWNGENYILNDERKNSVSWSDDRISLADRYHYTCFNSSGVCSDVYYIYYFGDEGAAWYIKLSNGENIEEAKENMFDNVKDSNIKKIIDEWYANNMLLYSDKLEDTVFCNDRDISNGSFKGKDINAGESFSYLNGNIRNMIDFNPSVNCSNTRDSFSVNTSIGNGKLTYPIGLLTADELTMAGNGYLGFSTSSYLYTSQKFWLGTPSYFAGNYVAMLHFGPDYHLRSNAISDNIGIRPVISLRAGTIVLDGDGTISNPYVVE